MKLEVPLEVVGLLSKLKGEYKRRSHKNRF